MPAFLAGALAVGVISGAYQAELYRGAYLAIPKGELEAARACGMGPMLMFRRIIAPQVLRFALPGLNNLWQVALKDSSLISVTGLAELMRVSQVASGSTRQPFVFYLAGGALYLVLTVFSNRIFEFAEGAPRAACAGRAPEWTPPSSHTFLRLIAALPLTLEVWALSSCSAALVALGLSLRARQRRQGAGAVRARLCVRVSRLAAAGAVVRRLLRPRLVSRGAREPRLAVPAQRLHLRRAEPRALHRRLSERDLPHGAGRDSAGPD